ncbi:uncharacterized protein UHO2_03625 [Ustilago hordei]|uniref:Uncharacterized protein n=1 Tax=Ustilago hordei TaxID=120017 RepID=I2G087_USTHO|nr:uncharacterized protein UHO2_03625 [Ustilago hordei]CCF52580.1 uncharacterized protein UHOR_04694 [Ustilago hordei]SYW75231.1 uncharacterized protein UHO2_03625 [Ustilago hordei]
MPVPDNASSAFAGNGTTNHLAVDEGIAGVLSLSQSISASVSDLKRPASAASSNNDGSQTISQTKAAKTHYGKAARAFLAKDLQTALVQSQHAADLLLSSSQLGSSLTASSFLDSDLDLQKLVDKVAILRLTVFTQVYTDKQISDSIHDKLTQAKQQTSSTTSSDGAAIDRILLLLSKQPQSLISHLWFEALRLCTHTSGENDAPSLDPTPETMHLAIELSASVISSAVLAALRLDALNPAARTGRNAARLIAEWYLASFSSAFGAAPPTPKAAAAYEKIVGLYSLHVLASRLDEWEYAREFVGYSSLAESVKFGLLEQINEAQAHLTAQSEREQEAVANAQKTYLEEKAKRAAEEKQAKEAAVSKSGSKSGSKARDLASGMGNFLTGKKEQVEATAGGGKASANGSSSGSSGSGSDSGTRSSRRQRSQSPAYFSPRNGTGESSACCSTSPSISPGSTRSVESASKQSASKDERRSLRRSSGSRSSDYDGGNESSTSVASNHSRRSARKEAASASEAAPTAGKEARTKDDRSYASTRAHLSRYIEGDHGHKPSAASNRRNSERDLTWKRPSGDSILSSIPSMFDFRKASQTRTWLMSAIVMLIVFYRIARRPPAAASNAAGRARRNAAAQDARSKLVGKHASAGGGVIGINWLFLVWRKVMDTIRMGTQVTYL